MVDSLYCNFTEIYSKTSCYSMALEPAIGNPVT